jgi:SAM-dependent methyltransferase
MDLRLTLLERVLRFGHRLPGPVIDVFGSVLYGRALAIAVRRGYFEALAKGPAGVDAIAKVTGFHLSAIRLMGKMFVLGGYLCEEGDGFGLTAEGRTWLVAASPTSVTWLIRYFELLHQRWSRMEYTLDHGRPPVPYFALFNDVDWKTYVYGMRDLARLLMPRVLPRLKLPAGSTSVVDLGGSHALYSIELARLHPELKATVIDFPPALTHAGEIVREAGMQGRVTLVPGDLTSIPLPGESDALLLFNVIHGFGEQDNRTLIERCRDALKPGGRLFILDQLVGTRKGSMLDQLVPLSVGMNMLTEIGGNTYRAGQVIEWCEGFSSARHVRLRIPGIGLIVAER